MCCERRKKNSASGPKGPKSEEYNATQKKGSKASKEACQNPSHENLQPRAAPRVEVESCSYHTAKM